MYSNAVGKRTTLQYFNVCVGIFCMTVCYWVPVFPLRTCFTKWQELLSATFKCFPLGLIIVIVMTWLQFYPLGVIPCGYNWFFFSWLSYPQDFFISKESISLEEELLFLKWVVVCYSWQDLRDCAKRNL